jgi:hypothetical protein
MRRVLSYLAVAVFAALAPLTAASAAGGQLSGAIFTTDVTGAPVNLNHYAAKTDVYLNGGPGINAPVDAAGLPAGVYSFQVTDPSGKTLLSSDPVACRQVTVDASGRFTSTAPSPAGCAHATSTDQEDLGITVQLFPYDDTPNNGGVYKVWITPTSALNCSAPGNKHCFVPGDSKTDNFKVKATSTVEIDTTFSVDGSYADGMAATWTDTLGASNVKYSEYNPAVHAFHEAHVEAVEAGTHTITVSDQTGCTIGYVTTPTGATLLPANGTVRVPVSVKNLQSGDKTYFVRVTCQ